MRWKVFNSRVNTQYNSVVKLPAKYFISVYQEKKNYKKAHLLQNIHINLRFQYFSQNLSHQKTCAQAGVSFHCTKSLSNTIGHIRSETQIISKNRKNFKHEIKDCSHPRNGGCFRRVFQLGWIRSPETRDRPLPVVRPRWCTLGIWIKFR